MASETGRSKRISHDIPQYEIVNVETGTVEAGPFYHSQARDRLETVREKVKRQAEDTPVYVPVKLRLRKVET